MQIDLSPAMITAIAALLGSVALFVKQRSTNKEMLNQVKNHHAVPLRVDLDTKFASIDAQLSELLQRIDRFDYQLNMETSKRHRMREWAREEHGRMQYEIASIKEGHKKCEQVRSLTSNIAATSTA